MHREDVPRRQAGTHRHSRRHSGRVRGAGARPDAAPALLPDGASRDIIPNDIRSHKNLGNLVDDARSAGLVDRHAIEDRTRDLRRRPHREEPQEIIDAIARQHRIDCREGRESYVEARAEKDALIGIVEQIGDKPYVARFPCRGRTGQSEPRGAAMRLKRRCDAGRHAVPPHLGDHDPSGKDMGRGIVARSEPFGADDVEFRRLALNLDRIEGFGPPPNPTKPSDSRAQGCIERFGCECRELDALDPSVVGRLIDENVRMYRDEGLYRDVPMRENEEKGALRDLRDGYQGLIQNWSEIRENHGICQQNRAMRMRRRRGALRDGPDGAAKAVRALQGARQPDGLPERPRARRPLLER